MKQPKLLLMFVALFTLLIAGCSDENNVVNSTDTQFNVIYKVSFLTEGAVKISHKDSNGNELTDDPVSATWEREYQFQDRVDALLDVEISDTTPTNQVTVQLAIFVNGDQQQQATSIITADKKSTLSLSRP